MRIINNDIITPYMEEPHYIFFDIQNNAPQTFTHKFSDGRVFVLKMRYNKTLDNWVLDIYQQLDNNETEPMALGILMESGLDVLSQFKYKDLGELYIIPKVYLEIDSPTYNTLNSQFCYLWGHK